MPELIVMGVAAATTDLAHENTHFLLRGDQSTILIDCPAKALQRTLSMGIPLDGIGEMILTHFHPDHVGGFAGFMLDSWLMGRKAPLRVFGPHHTLKQIGDTMMGYAWGDWAGFYPISFTHLVHEESAEVLENEDFRITASPVHHYVPTVGLRIEAKASGYVLAYSSDTSPCAEVIRLAEGADLLIHEATGNEPLGHSSAYQAGEVAAEAGAKKLGLIHYNVFISPYERLIGEAQEKFSGEVFLCKEGMTIDLG